MNTILNSKDYKIEFQNSFKESPPFLQAHWQVTRATLRPKLAKELTKPALRTAFKGGFGISLPTKNKINSCSVATLVRINEKKD